MVSPDRIRRVPHRVQAGAQGVGPVHVPAPAPARLRPACRHDLAVAHPDHPVGARAATSASWVIRTMVRPGVVQLVRTGRGRRRSRRSRGCRSARRPGSGGSVTSARATATRCCCPPDSSPGRWSTRSPSPTRSSAVDGPLAGARRAARRRRPAAARRCASAVIDGSRLNCWKTKPIRRLRTSARSSSAMLADVLAGQVVACRSVGTSRQPMMCISVDLPEPDGPMIATYSPRRTSRLTPRSAAPPARPVR